MILGIGEFAALPVQRHAQSARVEPAQQRARELRVGVRKSRRALPEHGAAVVFAKALVPARGEGRAARFPESRAEAAVVLCRAVLVVLQA